MYIKPIPVGVNPPINEDRLPIWKAISGDKLEFTTYITLPDGVTPATPTNSNILFRLAEDRFSKQFFWEGSWFNGITPVDPTSHPGLIRIRIPNDVGNRLRRGAYNFSLSVSDLSSTNTCTPVVGTLIIEYEPTSPQHSIRYKESITSEEII